MAPTFRADHIGSLLRPQYLMDALAAVSDYGRMHSKFSPNADPTLINKAHEAERRAIEEVVNEQLKRDITPITSGEFERSSFVSGFFENLEGIEIRFLEWDSFRSDFPIVRPYLRREIPGRDVPVAVGKVRWKESAYMKEWLYVRSLLPEEKWKDVKITIPAPNWSHTQLKDGCAFTGEAYEDEEEYLRDVGEAVRMEVLALYDAGVRFIQIDDPMIAMLCDESYLTTQQTEEGKSLPDLLHPAILAHNTVVRDLPQDLTLAIHLCRGNMPKGDTAAIGSFEPLSTLFRDLNYTRFAYEFDDPEITGSFAPLQHLPEGKVVVLGIITTKDSELEAVEAMRARVLEAADVIATAQGKSRERVLGENLAVSPSCGFSSLNISRGTGVDEEVQWAKLGLVRRLAGEVLGGV